MNHRWFVAASIATLALWGGARGSWANEEFPTPPPPLSEEYFPCMENCHKDMEVNRTPRKLEEEHADVQLHHAEQFRWCLDCHDAQNRDKLHLQSGEKLDFTESYRLCGQCHGDKYRDWRKGIHGKRSGSWDTKPGADKQYLLCAHCHNPHSPQFVLKPDAEHPDRAEGQPEPPPRVPGTGTLKSNAAAAHGKAKPGAKAGH